MMQVQTMLLKLRSIRNRRTFKNQGLKKNVVLIVMQKTAEDTISAVFYMTILFKTYISAFC